MGALKIEHHGTQTHRFGRAEFASRYRENFGASTGGATGAGLPAGFA
jgi:hypothetical protein